MTEIWSEFAVAMAGVGAVLAGLVFVALSLNLRRILATEDLPARAGETLVVFAAVVLQCAVLLLPDQSRAAVGIELLVAGALQAALLSLLFVGGRPATPRQPVSWQIARIIAGTAASVPVAIAGLLILLGADWALYLVAAAIMWAIMTGLANAWVLVVEVVRDQRYRPSSSETRAADSPTSAESPVR